MEQDQEMDLTKYIKLSISELKVLKESYEEKIREREKQHWINSLQSKVNFDVRKTIRNVLLFILVALCAVVLYFGISVLLHWSNSPVDIMNIALPMMGVVVVLAIVQQLLVDGTGEWYREWRKIDLVLRKKEGQQPERQLNPKHVRILTLLAQQELNRTDIRSQLQRAFGKTLDNKTIDKYLEELKQSDSIIEQNKPYHSIGGRDLSNTPVYSIKQKIQK